MKYISDRVLRLIAVLLLILAVFFLASAFYLPVKAIVTIY
jgi:hypothetical protein